MPRTRHTEPIPLVLYEDPLSPWCLVAERRVRAAMDDLAGGFALTLASFPTRVDDDRAMSRGELRELARSARKAAKEPEAAGTVPDLWLSRDPPLTSLPALNALAAARLQGKSHEAALRAAIREAALFRGLNVSRTDVLLELAERAGLDLAHFSGALVAPATARRVRDSVDEAIDRGIRGAPALVIADEWLVAGARPADEYRTILRRYTRSRLGLAPRRTLH